MDDRLERGRAPSAEYFTVCGPYMRCALKYCKANARNGRTGIWDVGEESAHAAHRGRVHKRW